ncbi:hypothetical protein DBR43_09635 [Pedobacter sp. KBW06]|uniref:polysaccharide biosynthesis C-terminal domain-containing protein n=1 Tax=Pedobacter sp. KBW06 TaxID=2153359 RepID=UPI000F5945BA|nr:oligosaccharide flippase family protein [Pedobacter sp. KBW06]RQO75588.1 hypothetical protein DBR43_09635 [Pedobacter sp. KBW06]
MGIIIRQAIKSSIVTYIGVLIGTLNFLFLFNRFLSTEQLGFYTTISSFPLIYASFANLGTSYVGIRFFNRFSSTENKHNGFLGYMLIAPLVGFSLFILIYSLGQDLFQKLYFKHSPLLVKYYWYFPLITFALIYMTNLEAYSRVHLRIVIPTMLREVFLKASNSILALLFGFHYITFDQLLYGIAFAYFLNVCFLLIYIKVLGRLYLDLDFSFLSKPIFKEMYRYGLWTILGGVTATLLINIEQTMLPAYQGGLNSTAIFFIAANIGIIITIPRNAVASISDPLLAASWKANNLAHVHQIYQKSALNLFIIGSLLFLAVWVNIDAIFMIIPNSDIYSLGKFVVLMVGINSVFDMATGLNSEILRNSSLYRYDLVIYITRFMLLMAANLIFIPLYSYNGAAFSLLISGVLYNLSKFYFIKQKLGIQPFSYSTLKVLLLGLAAYGIVLLIPNLNDSFWGIILGICIKSLAILTIYGIGVLFFDISQDISKAVRSVLRTKPI